MMLIIGYLLVFLSMIGGFMLAGGHPAVLLHLSEFVIIGGIALGVLVIASPTHVMKDLVRQMLQALRGSAVKKDHYVQLLTALYEIFMVARRDGMIALEEHVVEPGKSPIFQRYDSVLADPVPLQFLCNGLKPIIDGKIKPDQLKSLFDSELAAREAEDNEPVQILQLVGDSLPGIGIVAAVLGIINTMGAIADGPEKVGIKVAAALTGTFLGIYCAYGFVNPLANRVKLNNFGELRYLRCIAVSINSYAKGMAPLMAVEVGRRTLDSSVQPTADELEEAIKAVKSAG